jgi:hypothetical protein
VILESGVPPLTLHAAASPAICSGTNVKAGLRMLGHASAAMTLDVYADLFDDYLDAVATRLDEDLAHECGQKWPNADFGPRKSASIFGHDQEKHRRDVERRARDSNPRDRFPGLVVFKTTAIGR